MDKDGGITNIKICGLIASIPYQRARFCATSLNRHFPRLFAPPVINGMLEVAWNHEIKNWCKTLHREMWCSDRPVKVWLNDQLIGTDIDLFKNISCCYLMKCVPREDMELMKCRLKKEYLDFLKKDKRVYVYLDMAIQDTYIGTMTFQLYSDLLPKTCQNFKALCMGLLGGEYSYKDSLVHRVVKQGWIQGGDIVNKTGGGGRSIYGPTFEDENYAISHDRRGVLSMAHNGRHTNSSQFFVTLKPSLWMDELYVAFGQLVEGVKCLEAIENIETFYESPVHEIKIVNCGKLNLNDAEDRKANAEREQRMKDAYGNEVNVLMKTLITSLSSQLEDVLDPSEVTSQLRIQFYFLGLYSVPDEIIESCAQFLRALRRDFLRFLKPEATEVVEALTYDLLMGVLARLRGLGVTLDDTRAAIGHSLYQKYIKGIQQDIETFDNEHILGFLQNIIETAYRIIQVLSKELKAVKRDQQTRLYFEDLMNDFVLGYVLQKSSFEEKDTLSRMGLDSSILDLIVSHQETLRKMREESKAYRNQITPEFQKWLCEVIYVRDTDWIRHLVLEDESCDPIDEVMYGAISVGLVEMCYILMSKQKETLHSEMGSLRAGELTPVEIEPEQVEYLGGEYSVSELDVRSDSNRSLSKPPEEIYLQNEDYNPYQDERRETEVVAPPPSEQEERGTEERESKEETESEVYEISSSVPEELDVRSLNWLEGYVSNPTETITRFVEKVHFWLEIDSYNGKGKYLKNNGPVIGQASTLSLAISIGVLMQDHNNSEVKEFMFDLWKIYLQQLVRIEESSVPETDTSTVESVVEDHGSKSVETSGDSGVKEVQKEEEYFGEGWNEKCVIFYGESDFEKLVVDEGQIEFSPVEGFESIRGEWTIQTLSEVVDVEKKASLPELYKSEVWIKFLAEITKRGLGKISKASRLPPRLYLTKDSEIDFDERMQEWVQFNNFRANRVGRQEIIELIDQYHVSECNLDTTARSFMKMKAISRLFSQTPSELLAESVTGSLMADVLGRVFDKNDPEGSYEMVKRILSDLVLCVLRAATTRHQGSVLGEYEMVDGSFYHELGSEHFEEYNEG